MLAQLTGPGAVVPAEVRALSDDQNLYVSFWLGKNTRQYAQSHVVEMDANEDGEFCVALRCALLTGPVARCFAGVGVVRDSVPAAELAETEVKLQALLPVLAL